MNDANDCIRWLSGLSMADLPLVGGKTASLGEMFRELRPLGVRIPDGFAVTAAAYREALDAAGAWGPLHALLDRLDKHDLDALAHAGAQAREIVYAAPMPAPVEAGIRLAWRALQARFGPTLSVAVRSSATAEDLPNASFAGQHDTYLNVRGEQMLVDAIKRCQASLFTDRAISYRIDQGFDHFKVALSVVVMQMVRSDLASSGVVFTLDTESGHPDVVFITGAWGLGENVVQGAVDPDEFHVHKPTFRAGYRCVLRRRLGRKQIRMVYSGGDTRAPVVNQPTPAADRARFCLSDTDVLALTDAALKIEAHYSRRAGSWRPMDIEWAKDGPDGPLYIVQARPETSVSRRAVNVIETYVLEERAAVRVQGRAVGEHHAALLPDQSEVAGLSQGAQGGEGLLFLGLVVRLDALAVGLDVRGHRPAGGFPGHHLAQQRGAPAADFAEHEQVVVRLRHLQSEPRSLLGPRLPDPGQRFLQQLGRLGKPQRRGIDAQAQVGQ